MPKIIPDQLLELIASNRYDDPFLDLNSEIKNPSDHNREASTKKGLNDFELDKLIKALSTNSRIHYIKLDHNNFSDNGIKVLAAFLSTNSTIIKMSLQFNEISIKGLCYIA
ncbi:MAG: hypothetical protein JWM09_1153 [Francisellaceae bacterium]|nr:hypothetical protein [Francisellaceae bacterium]